MDRTTSASRTRRHAALMGSCALGLVLAVSPQAAHAQDAGRGFQGNVSPGGVGTVNVTTGGQSTTIDVKSAQAVVNWTPTDTSTSGTIDFLPDGYSASFISTNLSDYTVLNRILPGGTAKIGLNGKITSSSSDGSGGQNVGGNVWFYTPNGFVIGPRAPIQVGRLVMTTNDIVFGSANTGGDDLTDLKGNVLFRGTTPGSSIVISPGAQLTGSNSSSYIALVSPRIEQGGTVSADRSIAYVAANKVDMRINAGNFDIVVGEGTDDANGIVHTGTTTGAASNDFTDAKTMHFVAVPKNTALTMLLSGSIGYAPATSVFSDGSSIVLTAGDTASPTGNIDIGATRFSNNLFAHATGDLTVAPPSSESVEGVNETTFETYATLLGDQSVHLKAVGGSAINANRGLSIYSDNAGGGGTIDISAGPASLIPPDPEFPGAPDQFTGAGSIFVSGGLGAYAQHFGAESDDGTTGADGHGGTVNLFADGGFITSDYTYLYASADGGFGTKTGGDGFGGTINVRAGLGGAINTGYLQADAHGDGGGSYEFTEFGSTGGFGGVGHGGTITIADSSGSTDDDPAGGFLGVNEFSLNASAVGGNSLQRASGMGGDAFGGTIDITIDRQNQELGYLYGYATAVDGDGGSVDPIGGDITMTVGGGVNVTLSQLYLDAGAQASVNSPAGAFGKGGTIDLTIRDEASLGVSGDTTLTATADVASFCCGVTAASSPDLTGGTVRLTADSGSLSTNNLTIEVSANNVGATTSAGFAHGGTAAVTAANGGSISTFVSTNSECTECLSGGFFNVDAEGYGTSGLSANLVTGGDITLSAQSGGSIYSDSGEIDLHAGTDFGRFETTEGVGVTGQGGTIAIDAIGGAIQSAISADVSGQGGDADNGGGSGTGGTIAVRVLQGGELQSSLFASAEGFGGYTYISGRGGDGTGGRLTFTSDEAALFTDFGLEFYGDGEGGTTYDGVGGDGYGGSAQIDVVGGKHSWSEAYLSATGTGAFGNGDGSFAGSGYGSVDGLNFHLGGGGSLALDYLALDARGMTGSGGSGNEAVGGKASLLVDGLASLNANLIGLSANGMLAYEERSPDSYDTTPNATGGTVSVIADTSGTITTPFLEVSANGTTGAALATAGSATGGTATVGASAGGLINLIAPPIVEGPFLFGGLILEAQGLGAEGPSAANATGGTATLYTAGGTISSVLGITVTADATQGDFANSFVFDGPANGLNATGGTASVEMRAGGTGGSITAPSLTVNARGLPNGAGEYTPVQGAGGIGQGGSATLSVAQGALETGDIVVDASGFGGVSAENTLDGTAYVSGTGTGGSARFAMSGGSVDTTSVSVVAQGIGADGQGNTETATASLASTGAGGAASFVASGGTLTDSGALRVDASGQGGAGGFNPNVAPGGDGADGFGGTATFITPAGGNASLGVAGDINLTAEGRGGDGGFSYSEQPGNGGRAVGGTAAMNLADIAFDFGNVIIDANGVGGLGTANGDATGGDASFSLVDSGTAAASRTIGLLDIAGSGNAAAGAQSIGGSANFTAEVGGTGAALTITGDLSLNAAGDSGPAGLGIAGSISGAPVTVGGLVVLTTPRDANFTISPTGALDATDDLDVSVGGTFSSTGAISTASNAYVFGGLGINMTDLSVGGATLLTSSGPVVVSRNLSSVGPVTVSGSSVLLRSFGGLTFTDADATSGDLEIQTAGDLLVATVDATGAVTLTSTGGSVHNTGAVHGIGITYNAAGDVISDTTVASGGFLTVDAGGTFIAPGTVSAVGNVSLSADLGLNLSAVVSGGSTALAASNGALTIGSLTSPGGVSAIGRSVAIASPGALTFTSAQATAGNLTLSTAGSLAVAQGGASNAVQLTSSTGSVTGTGPVTAGGNLAIGASTGIQFGTLGSGGTTSLITQTGPVTVASLTSIGAVTARGDAINIASPGALNFTDVDAANGNVVIQTAGNLTLGTVDATGSATLTSTGGAIAANGAITANGIAMSSLANLTLNGLSTPGFISLTSTSGSVSSTGPIAAGGNLAVAGNSGITLGTATSGGTTALTSANGVISVANLLSSGAVTASGRSLTIGSSGALQFANAVATAGNIAFTTAGNLIVSQANASGALALASTGGSVASTGTLSSGGNAVVSGQTGVALGNLASGGTTTLTSAAGNVQVANLTSAGAVDASGRAVTIGSSGALTFSNAQASAGNLSLTTTGNLTLAQAGASGSLALTSTGGSVAGTGPITSGATASLSGDAGIALASLASGGTTSLTAANGAVSVTALTSTGAVTASGRSIDLRGPASLTIASAQATAGNLALQAAQNLTISGTVDGVGVSLTGGNVAIGGQARATAALDVLANQLFTVNGSAIGQTIGVTAGDVAIGQTGRIGSRGVTRSITLRNGASTSPMNIGGTGQQGEFSVDRGEAARLFADQSITFVSQAGEGTGGDARIGDLAMAFGNDPANLGAGGLLKVDAGGVVTVNGAVALTTVSDADTFSIDPQRIDVIAGGGSIVMKNAAGALRGSLELQAGTIAVADQTTLDTIAALSDFAAISAALDKPGAAASDGGYLQAGTIDLLIGQGLFIQNSGTSTEFDDRRGFRANALNIDSTGTNPMIAINGVITGQTGDLLGLDTIQGVTVNGVAATTIAKGALLTINGCAAGVKCGVPDYTFGGLSDDELEGLLVTADQPRTVSASQLVQIEDNEPLITPPLVDEPITGVGNDDLWQVKCTPDGDKNCPAEEGSE